jgi:DNA/RNA endonuclease G (NUC1)
MRLRRTTRLVALAFVLAACSDRPVVIAPVADRPFFSDLVLSDVRFSEIHYDNTGTDAGEAIEISGPAGTDLSGWQVVLYNGAGGASYNTTTLAATIPATCDTRGVVVITYAVNGIQNGSPDGMALVNGAGAVVEFLSYEGTFAATNGPALGLTAIDIGVSEAGTEPLGQSLQRHGDDTWTGPVAGTFGACNDNDVPPPPPPPPPPPGVPPVRLSEIHYDNAGTDAGEAIEVEGPAGTDLTGWSVVLYNGNGGVVYDTKPVTGVIADQCSGRGVVVVNYPVNGIQNGSPDGLALVNGSGALIEFVSYEGTFVASDGAAVGLTATDIGVLENGNEAAGQSLQRDETGTWHTPATASFGSCNTFGGPPPGNAIVFSGRLASDPPLPVGFQDQLFATERSGGATTIPTTFTWSSETPALASIDLNGVFTALGAGTMIFRATAEDGTTSTYSLPSRVAALGGTAQYAGNAEFGEPADADAGDDFILRHLEYTASYSNVRNTPNWVSYDLDASHFGPEDRCDCFTFDPDLPSDFAHYTTNDYTGAGTIAGFGIDRGHLARSFDRTSGSLDNAFTFLFSNIIPQAADLNQGPWAALENFLGDLARFQDREVYIVTGVAGNRGSVKNEGLITIPSSTWKVAVIMPRDRGLADVHETADLDVIAVNMPNEPGIRNVPWETYKTTVDAIEALSGYDVLALLPDQIEIAVESGTHAPVATTNGPYASAEGSAVNMSAAGSSDLDGDPLTYQWDFGDGQGGTGLSVAHTYAQDGRYPVTLTVTDSRGLIGTSVTATAVTNVAPAVTAFSGATLMVGETYSATGSFTDPGADPWSGTVDYGDGEGEEALAISGKTFALAHRYDVAGGFTVTVRIADDDASASRSATVTVLTQSQGIESAIALVEQLGAGAALGAQLYSALRHVERGRPELAVTTLNALLHTLEAQVHAHRLDAAAAGQLRALIVRIKQSVAL